MYIVNVAKNFDKTKQNVIKFKHTSLTIEARTGVFFNFLVIYEVFEKRKYCF